MNRQYRRNGFTLIEMLLVLSLITTLLGGTFGLLSLVQKSNQRGQENLLQRQEMRRFADDVRRDMRLSKSAEIKDTELVFTYKTPGSNVTYRYVDESLIRSQTSDGDKTAKSEDRYRIASNTTSAIEWIEEGSQLQWTFTSPDRPKHPIRIFATRRAFQ